jgi:hypothetical protein
MSSFRSSGLYPIFLHSPKNVQRGLTVACPVCREQPGQPCKLEEGKPVVHDARESLAYHGKKIWV